MEQALKLADGLKVRFRVLAPGAALIEWLNEVSEAINQSVLGFAEAIRKKKIEGLVDIVPTYCAVGLYYNPDNLETVQLLSELEFLAEQKTSFAAKSTIHKLPVCYDVEYGPDLKSLAEKKGLDIEEVISMHTQTLFYIYFIGFLPGFMYMGGLDRRLHMERRAFPRPRISPGSVGIGGVQTGVYPITSPGGWNIIGRSPIKLFDAKSSPPCRFSPGDCIQFIPINKGEFLRLQKAN